MPAYLVHGVPDGPRLWDPIRAQLRRRDVVIPTLPGFGAPLPPGFHATCDEYAQWLIADIASLGAPVDLVGHDWGAILTLRVASLRPDLVRTLAAGSGVIDAEYRWHETAVAWQTPGIGEQLMTMFGGELAIESLVAAGVDRGMAETTVARIDDRMRDAILRLYRSAVDISDRWSSDLSEVRCPALVIWPVDDPFVERRFGARIAAAIGAQLLEVDGGHWWPLRHPTTVGTALEELWSASTARP